MTGYYLLDHPNPGAVANPDGTYWGRQVMSAPPIWITVHTAESFADLIGADLGAENVAAYFTRSTTAASYHTVVDSDSIVPLLPSGLDDLPVHVAYHCANRNTGNLGISFACRSSEWPTMPADYRRRMLANGADVVARWIRAHDIPLRRVTLAEVDAGVPGITGHGIVQPEDRSDPGLATVFQPSLFPWDEFLGMVAERLGATDGGTTAKAEEPEMRVCETNAGLILLVDGWDFQILNPNGEDWDTVTNVRLVELARAGLLPVDGAGNVRVEKIGDNALGVMREVRL